MPKFSVLFYDENLLTVVVNFKVQKRATNINVPVFFSVNVPGGPLVQIFTDSIEFFGRTKRVECKLFHIRFDETILRVNWEYIVNKSFVTRPKCTTTPTTAWKSENVNN